MVEMKYFLLDESPTLDDIKEAYDLVIKNNIVVVLKWYMNYTHTATISPNIVNSISAQEYYEVEFPKLFPV